MAKLPKYLEFHHPEQPGVFLVPPEFGKKFESAVRYKAKPRDLFLCNYPKCGITWLQNIVWRITHQGQSFARKMEDHIAFLEFDGGEKADSTRPKDGGYNIIKTHFPHKWVPKHPEAKYIFIAREPKDVCVSLYYHITGFTNTEWEDGIGTFDDIFDGFLRGKLDAGDYFQMLTEWYEVKDDPSILFLLYEDLLTSTKETTMKIAKYLGPEYVSELSANNFERLDNIIRDTSFTRMQREDDTFISEVRTLPFIRKGIIGDWKNHMSSSQTAEIDERLRKAAGGKGAENLWIEKKDE